MTTQQSGLKLSPPWDIYFRKVEALFAQDPQIEVRMDDDNKELIITVANHEKADAIEKLLPKVKDFGNIQLKITVVCNINDENVEPTKADLIEKAFKGNKALKYVTSSSLPFQQGFDFAVFENTVVQFYTDDLSDLHGVCSTLYQDIAKRLFEGCEGIYFCTDLPD